MEIGDVAKNYRPLKKTLLDIQCCQDTLEHNKS